MAMAVAMFHTRATTGTGPPPATGLGSRQPTDPTQAHRLDNLRHRRMLRNQHVDAGLTQGCECAASDTGTDDGIHVESSQGVDVVAGVRAMVMVLITHNLQPTAIHIHHREERCTAEMAIGARC